MISNKSNFIDVFMPIRPNTSKRFPVQDAFLRLRLGEGGKFLISLRSEESGCRIPFCKFISMILNRNDRISSSSTAQTYCEKEDEGHIFSRITK